MRDVRLLLFTAAFASGLSAIAVPATAQVADRVVDVYGDDPCPASNGQEIVVCRRLPNSERFRIPKTLRENEAPPQKLGSGAAMAVNSTGGNAAQVQSCNAIGAGYNAGCWKKQIDKSVAERKRNDAQGESIP